MSTLRQFARMIALLAVMAVLAPLQVLVLAVSRGPASLVLPAIFHRLVCRILSIRLEVRGTAVPTGQVMFLCNHLSYLDIPAIGSVLRACFVAKEDVRAWPLIGSLARLQHTVFVSRNPRRVPEVARSLHAALATGHHLVLFPEGTTSDGSTVLPFKSSLFAILSDPALKQVALQPMTIELLAVDDAPIRDGRSRDRYAYYGEMHLLPHLMAFMRGRGARLRLTLHAPLPASSHVPRKALAVLAHANVARGLAESGGEAPS